MTLRTQYSLRQALPVALFAVPLYVLERVTAASLGPYDLELTQSSVAPLALVGLPILGLGTFALAYARFEIEFERRFLVRRRPLQVVRFVVNWALILTFLLALMALSLGETGLPDNQYHWARLGIMGLGLFSGLCLLKWVYFDWLEREREEGPPPSSESSSPVSPALTPRGKSGCSVSQALS